MSDNPPANEQAHRRSSIHAEGPAKNSQQNLHAMINAIWQRSKERVAGHVEILQQAKRLAFRSELDEPARLRAVDSAHKLAGVLGTFGLPRGTDLARVVEEAFGQPVKLSRAEIERIGAALDELSSLVKKEIPSNDADPSAKT
jgi:hypothetical protein